MPVAVKCAVCGRVRRARGKKYIICCGFRQPITPENTVKLPQLKAPEAEELEVEVVEGEAPGE